MTKTNSLTTACLNVLALNGFKAWKVYNGAVYDVKDNCYRKDKNKLLGIPDINGFHLKTGKAIYVEIKGTKSDKPSIHQIRFCTMAQEAGCYVFTEVRDAEIFHRQLVEKLTLNK